MFLRICETRLGLRNSTTRIPFRYGKACLTSCPQAALGVVIESGARRQEGFAGDCFPPGWFDKDPAKDFQQQIAEMLTVIELAQRVFAEEFARPKDFFSGWRAAYNRIHQQVVQQQGLPALLASFGISLLERAVMDAMARAAGLSFFQAVQDDLYGLRPGQIHPELEGTSFQQWLPAQPRSTIHVRHTVGLSDPLTLDQVPSDERLNDGLPQTLEQYLQQSGIKYLKIKVSNQLDHDLERLASIAALLKQYRGQDYFITLDGNEQYEQFDQFGELVESMRVRAELHTLWDRVLAIEQPLNRAVALDAAHSDELRGLSREKPVIIDESDGELKSFAEAASLGYRGVSSKNCKGPVKSLLNAGLAWRYNDGARQGNYLMTGEDLCCVGVVPVQADLCLSATLGLEHVERNGHHYHPGLSYLPAAQQQAAYEQHPDFYRRHGEFVCPRLENGQFQIGSLQCVGFGFASLPRWEDYEAPDAWNFQSLGLSPSS